MPMPRHKTIADKALAAFEAAIETAIEIEKRAAELNKRAEAGERVDGEEGAAVILATMLLPEAKQAAALVGTLAAKLGVSETVIGETFAAAIRAARPGEPVAPVIEKLEEMLKAGRR